VRLRPKSRILIVTAAAKTTMHPRMRMDDDDDDDDDDDEEEEEEEEPNPLLFTRARSIPVFFSMSKGTKMLRLKNRVIVRGGVVEQVEMQDEDDTRIRLADPDLVGVGDERDVFDCKYVDDCIKRNALLENLRDYRRIEKSKFKEYNPFDVLCGKVTWSKLDKAEAEVDEGEPCSDLEDDGILDDGAKRTHSRMKSGKAPYTRKDQLTIVNYIVKEKTFNELKGNSLWKRMEVSRVCSAGGGGHGRSWQSMKEHFRKQIMTQIGSYKLSDKIVSRFRRANAGETVNFSSDAEDRDEDKNDEQEEVEQQTYRPPKNGSGAEPDKAASPQQQSSADEGVFEQPAQLPEPRKAKNRKLFNNTRVVRELTPTIIQKSAVTRVVLPRANEEPPLVTASSPARLFPGRRQRTPTPPTRDQVEKSQRRQQQGRVSPNFTLYLTLPFYTRQVRNLYIGLGMHSAPHSVVLNFIPELFTNFTPILQKERKNPDLTGNTQRKSWP
jgi:hypothetical protein